VFAPRLARKRTFVKGSFLVLVVCALLLAFPGLAQSQSESPTVTLQVATGRQVDIVVDQRVVIKHVGQPIDGLIVQPVYAYDRVVIPAGTRVTGHITALDSPSKVTRVQAILSGDLSPRRSVHLQFDTLLLASGERVPFSSVVTTEIPQVRRASAPPVDDEDQSQDTSRTAQAKRKIKARATTAISDARQQVHDVLGEIRQPGRKARLKDALVQRLPYHQQLINAGTGYHVDLLAPLDFGSVVPSEPAPANARPAPSSVVSAQLLATLSSATTTRGTRVQASVIEPVFSADHQLIVPEGTLIEGEVTRVKPARRLHRNGELRFLVETIHRETANEPAPLLASLSSVEVGGDASVSIDDEGGTTIKNPKTRFIAPALAVLALRANLDQHEHLDPDGDGHIIHSGSPGARTTGGFFGLGLLGIGLSQLSRPVGISLSIVGASRTMYRNVLGKGREVEFPSGTMMQLRLAPGPTGP
jgi:hypothetical protein